MRARPEGKRAMVSIRAAEHLVGQAAGLAAGLAAGQAADWQ